MIEDSAAAVHAGGAAGFMADAAAYYANAQLAVLAVTFLFLISVIFVLNRAVNEMAKARSAREQAEAVFTRLNGLLTGIENGDTPFNESARASVRRVSMNGPVRRTMLPPEVAAARTVPRKKLQS